mgnify:FL=1
MGWTSYYRNDNETDAEHIQREVLGSRNEIVESATVGTTFYAAVRVKATGETFGLVVLQERANGEYARKEITEDMGPAERSCPVRILDALPPTDNEYALAWRAACRRNAA